MSLQPDHCYLTDLADRFSPTILSPKESQRQWVGKPLSEETVGTFPDRCSGAIVSTQWTYTDPGPHDPGSEPSEHGHPIERCLPGIRWRDLGDGKGFDRNRFIVPHGNYLVNLGNPDEEKRKKSLECFIDDLEVRNFPSSHMRFCLQLGC